MCRQKALFERAKTCQEVNAKLNRPALRAFRDVLLAIQSNEPNNLAKAERAIQMYERDLKQIILMRKAQQQQKPSSPPPQQQPLNLVSSTPRPQAPPMGLKNPPPQRVKPPVKLDLKPATTTANKTTATPNRTPSPKRSLAPNKQVTAPKLEIEKPKVELTPGQKLGLILMPPGNAFVYCGLSLEGKKAILRQHNLHRRKFQRYDDGCKDLKWSNDLAKMAQAYAEKLVLSNMFQHSYAPGDIGENLANMSTSDAHRTWSPAGVTDAWYDEIKDFSYATMGSANGKMVGHFTQVVSRRTTAMGAGMAKSATTFYEIWVCNYGPAGNMTINGAQTNFDTSKITSGIFLAIQRMK